MTTFAPTPEGKAARERMMRLYGHDNPFQPPRPGFPGDPETEAKIKQRAEELNKARAAGLPPPQPPRPGVKPTVTGAPATPMTPKPAPKPIPAVRPSVKPTVTGAPATPITPKPAPKPSLVNPSRPKPIVTPKKQAMGFGGGLKKGGKVSSASKRADGIATKGKTKGRMI